LALSKAEGVGTPGNSYEYQRKGFAEFAFRKYMILKEMSLAEQTG